MRFYGKLNNDNNDDEKRNKIDLNKNPNLSLQTNTKCTNALK